MMNPDAKNCRNITKYIFEMSVHFNNKINIKIRVESPRILIPAIMQRYDWSYPYICFLKVNLFYVILGLSRNH